MPRWISSRLIVRIEQVKAWISLICLGETNGSEAIEANIWRISCFVRASGRPERGKDLPEFWILYRATTLEIEARGILSITEMALRDRPNS